MTRAEDKRLRDLARAAVDALNALSDNELVCELLAVERDRANCVGHPLERFLRLAAIEMQLRRRVLAATS